MGAKSYCTNSVFLTIEHWGARACAQEGDQPGTKPPTFSPQVPLIQFLSTQQKDKSLSLLYPT